MLSPKERIEMLTEYFDINTKKFAPLYYLPDYGGYWNYSTYDDMVTITFPEAGLLISMANYSNGGWYYANYNAAFKVVLPGASGVKAKKVSAVRKTADKTVKANATRFSRGQMLRNAPVRRDAKLMK